MNKTQSAVQSSRFDGRRFTRRTMCVLRNNKILRPEGRLKYELSALDEPFGGVTAVNVP
jgi:hypothetical protein